MEIGALHDSGGLYVDWNEWCEDRCAGRESKGCRGVAVLTGHMHPPPKYSDAAVFMWLRYNSVKSAFSRLKHPCQAPGLSHYDVHGAKHSRAVVRFCAEIKASGPLRFEA